MTQAKILLAEYVRTGSDHAFRELVIRYIDLVYSTALRLVDGDAHRAEDVAQTVFVDLARLARTLSNDVMLGGWLHRHTCFVAANTMRGERRRQSRERQAVEMNALQNESMADFSVIAPILDEAINELGEADRTAILLRFFEQHDFRAVGEALGSTEDAARMRVTRALDKLEELLRSKGFTTGTATLSGALSANAVQAAPVGLTAAISTTAALGGTTLGTAATATKAITMITLQKAIIGATVVVAVGTGFYQTRQAADLRSQLQTLQHQETPVVGSLDQMIRERDAAMGKLAALRGEIEKLNRDNAELLKLRGQIGLLRRELANAKDLVESLNGTNALAKIWSVGEIKPKANWKDAGLGSPLAAIETFWWAGANNDAERMKQCLVFDRKTNAEPVSVLYAKREARSNSGELEFIEGLRLLSQRYGLLDSNRASIEIVQIGARPKPDGTIFNIMNQYECQLLKVGEEWKVVRDPNKLVLTMFDEDSELIAKQMIKMDPKTLQQLMSGPRLPLRTLRAYEALKAKSTD